MALFDPWGWRDPTILAGGYGQAPPDRGPSPDDPADVEADEGGPGTEVDLVGYAVEATDGGIGSVVEASHAPGAAYLVVDTGPWIFGRRVLLPAGTVERVDHLARTVHVDRTRDQVKDSPEAADRNAVGDYYRSGYNS
jgi:hypothetical protein